MKLRPRGGTTQQQLDMAMAGGWLGYADIDWVCGWREPYTIQETELPGSPDSQTEETSPQTHQTEEIRKQCWVGLQRRWDGKR